MKKYTILALAVLALAACNKEKEFVPSDPQGQEITIIAIREDGGTKTELQADGKSVWWSVGDNINVFYGPGETPSLFTGQNEKASATAEFRGTIASSLPEDPVISREYFAVYPPSNADKVTKDGEITAKLRNIQTAVTGTFEPYLFPAVAKSEEKTMTFRSVGAGIKFAVGEDNVSEVVFRGNSSEILAGTALVSFNADGIPTINEIENGSAEVTVSAPEGGFVKGEAYFAVLFPTAFDKGLTITLKRSEGDPIEIVSTKARTLGRGVIANVGTLSGPKSLEIENIWAMYSSTDGAWNEYYGGTPGTDRNIAMDDEYVYIAENATTPKLWAISIADYKVVKAVNIEGVSGGVHPLCCPRVIKNTDASVNGGKDVLICSDLTRGGEDPILYMWLNGIENAPKKVTLTTWATEAWYGDTFTFSGSLQDGTLFFDKTDSGGNGIVTFDIKGVPGDKLYLHKRIDFNTAFGSHNGVCAYYPFPGNDNAGVYSPGRGFETRGRSATFIGDLKSEGSAAYVPALENLDYAEGRNGFILGYNYLEWQGKRYVIYGKQPNNAQGFVYVLEGEASADWLDIINKADVKFRRDLAVTSGSHVSGNSGMDVTARIIGGELYFAAQKQNVACGLYKLVYK